MVLTVNFYSVPHSLYRFGRRKALLLYSVIRAVGGIMCVVAPNYEMFAVARLITGTGIMGTTLTCFVLSTPIIFNYTRSYTNFSDKDCHTGKLSQEPPTMMLNLIKFNVGRGIRVGGHTVKPVGIQTNDTVK